jgi:tagaturonate reductase
MTRPIIQFGTSRFLQAHADLFVHEARQQGQDVGPITVVKTTPGADRAGRVAALKSGRPYPVRIRGAAAGKVIDETLSVASIANALDAATEWPAVMDAFCGAEIALSNTGDRGYELDAADEGHDYGAAKAPRSFPVKLLALLFARHRAGGRPLLFLPTELVSGNGRRLHALLIGLAVAAQLPTEFRTWLAEAVTIPDTLVDRIVSEPIEPVGAVAEPYALWAIQRGDFTLFDHPAITLTDDLAHFERLKLHILNLGHTVLAEIWQRDARPADETVRAILEDTTVADRLGGLYAREVIPGFARRDLGAEAERYVATTLERFRNLFLAHRLADIAQNHAAKKQNRIAAFLAWVRETDPAYAAPELQALL